MKKLSFIFAFLLISCTNSDKFISEEIYSYTTRIEINASARYLYGYLQFKNEENIPLSSLERYGISYFWIINGVKNYSQNPQLNYGSYSIELFLVDLYGDTISSKRDICLNEPLKASLLSPINNFSDLSKTDSIVFQYKVSGANCREYIRSSVYVKDSLLEGNVLRPPLDDSIYWRVKVFTEQEQDTEFSETRWIFPKN